MRLIDIEPFETQKDATGCKILVNLSGENYASSYALSTSDIPTVDAVPVKHGRWKLNKNGSGTCSECHRTQNEVWDYDTWQHYCGDCGAKMDLEEMDDEK